MSEKSNTYCDDGDNEIGRKECVTTKYTPGMFENVQSVIDFATCISIPQKSIALVDPTGEICTSKQACSFPAIKCNRGCCIVHGKGFYPLLGARGDAMMGAQYLRPTEKGHRLCDCDFRKCREMGCFPSLQGAINVPISARDVTL